MRVSKLSARTARAIVIAGVTIASVAGVTTYAIAQSGQPAGCAVTQPVYTNNDYKLVGTWQATLVPGQEVYLPNGDVGTCTKEGFLIDQP